MIRIAGEARLGSGRIAPRTIGLGYPKSARSVAWILRSYLRHIFWARDVMGGGAIRHLVAMSSSNRLSGILLARILTRAIRQRLRFCIPITGRTVQQLPQTWMIGIGVNWFAFVVHDPVTP